MRSSIILIISFILFSQPAVCQTKARITDVDFHLEDRYIVVNYNITGISPKEEVTVELKFITENNEPIIPKTMTGDVGKKMFGDGSKAILWDVVADQAVLSGNLKASVTIVSSRVLYSGPGNAFLSILIPGMGGYFVDRNKARSVLTTMSTIGLIAYGVIQKTQANKYYGDYNASTTPADMDDLFSKANSAQHSYYIATRVGAGIWALDIIWVTFKGFHNKKVAKSYYSSFNTDGLRLNYVNNGLQLGYSKKF
jgi:hypothetical protein